MTDRMVCEFIGGPHDGLRKANMGLPSVWVLPPVDGFGSHAAYLRGGYRYEGGRRVNRYLYENSDADGVWVLRKIYGRLED